jgi:hypothetical protein
MTALGFESRAVTSIILQAYKFDAKLKNRLENVIPMAYFIHA